MKVSCRALRHEKKWTLKGNFVKIQDMQLFQNFFFLFIFFDGQFRLFSFSDSNTYLDTEVFIIPLRFGGLEITLV